MLLFFKIDGVLNSAQSDMYHTLQDELEPGRKVSQLCPLALSNLDFLCRQIPDLKLVLTGNWRSGREVSDMRLFLEKEGFRYAERLIGFTPKLLWSVKDSVYGSYSTPPSDSEEIETYLKAAPTDRFLILTDEEATVRHLKPLTIKVDHRIGFSFIDVIEVLEQIHFLWDSTSIP